jgi:hypothetical protein
MLKAGPRHSPYEPQLVIGCPAFVEAEGKHSLLIVGKPGPITAGGDIANCRLSHLELACNRLPGVTGFQQPPDFMYLRFGQLCG